MTAFFEKKRDNNDVSNDDELITLEELRVYFPLLKKDEGFDYSGKCRYCNVKINFSDTTQVKIKFEKKEARKFSLYHKGCYERYLRRTID